LAGPLFLVVLSPKKDATRSEIARRIAQSGAEHGVGLIFGGHLLRYVLKDDGKFVDDLLNESSRPIPFLITSDPLEYDAMDLFEKQLNSWRGADPSRAPLLRFLQEVLSFGDIEKAVAVVWDSMVPDSRLMPTYRVDISQFLNSIRDYYRNQVGGPEGIYRIRAPS